MSWIKDIQLMGDFGHRAQQSYITDGQMLLATDASLMPAWLAQSEHLDSKCTRFKTS